MKFVRFLKQNFNIYYFLLVSIACLGLFLRAKAYFLGYTLWLDECSLSLSITNRGIFGFFEPLEHTQSAPPLFMMLTKLVTMGFGALGKLFSFGNACTGWFCAIGGGFGANEFALRLVPFISSLFSVPLFYMVSKKFLEKKFSILSALLLFCVNFSLIYYSVEFKQYSSDVFICLLMFLIFLNFDFKNSDIKKIFLLGCGAFLGVLFSIPVCFLAAAFVLTYLGSFIGIKCVKDDKGGFKSVLQKIFVFLIPFFILMPFYYLYVLYPSKLQMMSGYYSMWQSGFLTLNPLSFIIILRENLTYFFNQSNFVLFAVILLVLGFICVLRGVKIKNLSASRPTVFLAIFFLIVILASFFKIYPIKERVALYLLPYLLILIVKPLDMRLPGGIKGITVILMFLFFVSPYNIEYFKNLYPSIEFKKGAGDKLIKILKKEYKNSDVLVYNDASEPVYLFNSKRYNFSTDRFIKIKLVEYEKEYYTGLLNSLPGGYSYWFYYPNDYYKRPVVPFVKEWARSKKPPCDFREYEINSSYLLNVKT